LSDQSEIVSWSIESITCSRWKFEGDMAEIQIGNFALDTINFEVIRTPDGDILPMNSTSDFRSENWYYFTSEKNAIDMVLMDVLARLESFQSSLDVAQEWVHPSKWFVARGHSLDPSVWAALAYLFELRASMKEQRIIELLSQDMEVEPALAKERVRKLRDKCFLEMVGKGNFAEGRMTDQAKKILIEKGMMNA
jgi:hypothetical protein